MGNLKQQAVEWITAKHPQETDADFLAETRDIFQARLERMSRELLDRKTTPEEDVYIITAIAGEIGNNSFDHNLGKWPDTMGIFFGYEIEERRICIALADRGQGILKTLQQVRPELCTDEEALRVAFTEKISGRAPENRGNGLKFVKENVKERHLHLSFSSGSATAELNETMNIGLAKIPVCGCVAILTLE